jgi:protein-S-isoprenylcysteine O-methyltransferase Ste14
MEDNTQLRRLAPLLMLVTLVLGIVVAAVWRLTRWPTAQAAAGFAVVAVYLAWASWEGAISVRDARSTDPRADRFSNELYGFAHGATVLATLIWSGAPSTGARGVVAILLLAVGYGVRIAAVRSLGRFYSHRVCVQESHRVQTTGPYKWLRHPAYSGMLLIHAALSLFFASWVGAGCLVLLLAPAIAWRISIEERALDALPGYREFCRTRARLIPQVW